MFLVRLLLVVDGDMSLSCEECDDEGSSFISQLFDSFASAETLVFFDTAHRGGDQQADFKDPFNFARDVSDLSRYDEIWMLSYNKWSGLGPLNEDHQSYMTEEEIFAISKFMQNGGGVLASGDHGRLGTHMFGGLPRVRAMRKWFVRNDADESTPLDVPRIQPLTGSDCADMVHCTGERRYLFENQSNDIQHSLRLKLMPGIGIHSILKLPPEKALGSISDQSHRKEVVGSNGGESNDSQQWALADTLTCQGQSFIEYPQKHGHQEIPQIIATGDVIGDHEAIRPSIESCANGLQPTNSQRGSSTLAVYDGHRVGIGRVVTDSFLHQLKDFVLIGGFGPLDEHPERVRDQLRNDVTILFINTVKWLAHPRCQTS